jgi:O-antigen/teichoic acid export membrane protein
MKDLKERALRGGFAKMCAQAANFSLRVGSMIVLARVLDPKDFGLVAMATVVTGVFNLFKDAGLSTATVQRATISHEQLSTLFWINILVGAILAVLAIGAAPILATFYHEPRLFHVTAVLALGFLLNAAGVQHSALLQRQMRFGALAAIETGALIVSIAVGIGMAIGGFGYWALVAMTISLPGAFMIGCWSITGWFPGLPRRNTGMRTMMRFGGTVTMNSLVVYAGYNTDKILMGRWWGAEALGIYGRAYQLISIPTENLNAAVGSVALSALSRLQEDKERFKNYFLKGYSLTLALTVPLTIFCALFADDIIAVLLGSKWKDAAPIFRYLAPTILAFALINPLSWLLVSTGHIGRSLKMAFVIAPLVTMAYLAGLPFGSKGVAIGYSIMMTLLTVPLILWATHGLVVSSRDILRAVKPPFLSAGVAIVVSAAVVSLGGQWLPVAPRLVLEGLVVLASYLIMLLYVLKQKGFYFDLIGELAKRPSAKALEIGNVARSDAAALTRNAEIDSAERQEVRML